MMKLSSIHTDLCTGIERCNSMGKGKRISSKGIIIFALAFICTILFWLSALSEAYCGDEVTWTLSDTGVLTISGTGETFGYKSHGAPWYNQRDSISSVISDQFPLWINLNR